MVCIYCHSKTSVTNSRPQKRLGTTWRRRECQVCQAVFSTVEVPDLSASIRVRTKTGDLLPFERDILFVSIFRALEHRKDAVTAANALCTTVIAKLLQNTSGALLERQTIIVITETTLRAFDAPAATHYDAYHPHTNQT